MATVLARKHFKVLLVDMKWATGDLAILLDLKPLHSLADLCSNAARMDRVMLERRAARHDSGIHLLAPLHNFSEFHQVTSEGIQQTLTLARELFSHVLVDLDFSDRAEEAQVLRQASLILLVLRLDFSSLRNAQQALAYLEHLGVNRERVRIVVNRHGQPREAPCRQGRGGPGRQFFHLIPEDARTVNGANNNGVPLVLEYPSARWPAVSPPWFKVSTGMFPSIRESHDATGNPRRRQTLERPDSGGPLPPAEEGTPPAAHLQHRPRGPADDERRGTATGGPPGGRGAVPAQFVAPQPERARPPGQRSARRDLRAGAARSPDARSDASRDILVNGPKTVYVERQRPAGADRRRLQRRRAT